MIAPARKPTEMPVIALIDSDSYWVEAYFEETNIPRLKPGAAPRSISWTDRLRCKERFRA
jgi:hypothetical protein